MTVPTASSSSSQSARTPTVTNPNADGNQNSLLPPISPNALGPKIILHRDTLNYAFSTLKLQSNRKSGGELGLGLGGIKKDVDYEKGYASSLSG